MTPRRSPYRSSGQATPGTRPTPAICVNGRDVPFSTFTNSLKLLRQARERLGQGLRAVEADNIAESDEISLRNQ